MAATTQSAPTPAEGEAFNSRFIERVAAIPLVQDALQTAYGIIQSNSYTSSIATGTNNTFRSAAKRTEGLQRSFDPQLRSIDSTLNRGLDYVQAKYPYPFEAQSGEVFAKARAPADQAYSRASNLAKAAHDTTEAHLNTLRATSDQLQRQLSNVTSTNVQRVSETSHAILKELEGLLSKFTSHDLPASVHSALSPLASRLSNDYNEIKANIFSNQELSTVAKGQALVTYTRGEAIPLLNEAVNSLKALLTRGKQEAQTAAQETSDSASNVVEETKKTA